MRLLYYLFLVSLSLFFVPLFLLLSFINLFFSTPPIFFRQKRVGLNGQPFLLYKFRTMVVGAEKLQKKYFHRNEATGPAFKIHSDPRFTRIGKFLSHTGFDELPQLFNVLRGDMALFGPRPLPTDEAAKLAGWMRKRHDIKPGIISPWIFEGYHSRSFEEWMRSDITYVQTKSVTGDLLLLFKSVVFILRLTVRELYRR